MSESLDERCLPDVEQAVQKLLITLPGRPVGESLYPELLCWSTSVCNIVKQNCGRLLCDRLFQIIDVHIYTVRHVLQDSIGNRDTFIRAFCNILQQYMNAVKYICFIYGYMNARYMQQILHTDLNAELRKVFQQRVVDPHIPEVLSILVAGSRRPLAVHPTVMVGIINNLYKLDPNYAQLEPQLFAKYNAGVLPPCKVSELEQYIAATQQLQQRLRADPEFNTENTTPRSSRKRPADF